MTDILDLIDNATEHRCACGCNTQLPEDGPSAWFASQDCQRRWNESHATDPADVYNRPDGGDGWSRDAMVVGDGSSFAPTRFFLGDQEITDFVVPGSLAFERAATTTTTADASAAIEAYMRTVVVPESMEGRSGLVSSVTWVDEVREYWSAAPSAGYLRPVLEAATPGTWPDYVVDRIEALPDASVTITGYWDPPPVNVHAIMDDIIRWLSANRIDYRSVPIEAVPAIFDNRIFCPVYVRSRAGKLWVDHRSDSVRTRMVRARLRVPPPPVLEPWLASGSLLPVLVWAKRRLARHRMHTSYSSRLRSRRRRNRR